MARFAVCEIRICWLSPERWSSLAVGGGAIGQPRGWGILTRLFALAMGLDVHRAQSQLARFESTHQE